MVGAFGGNNRILISGFLDEMAKFGIFFVPVGELECWLKLLRVAGSQRNKPKWLTNIFAKMGSDPSAGDYLRARNNDVWKFIERVEEWIANPTRSGTWNTIQPIPTGCAGSITPIVTPAAT